MDKINRELVKQQAQQLIKGKVFYLFLIIAVVALLTNSFQIIVNIDSINNNTDDIYNYEDNDNPFYDFDDDDYDYDHDDNPFDNFTSVVDKDDMIITEKGNSAIVPVASALSVLSTLSSIVTIVFAPLYVTLAGIFVAFIRRNPQEELHLGEQVKGLFKNTFSDRYFKKLCLVVLRTLFTGLWSLLFIVPGIIYYYKTYFAYQLMEDCPNLSPTEALKLSQKLTDSSKSELFVLDLSFIGWFLLGFISLGIAYIYIMPYYYTTVSLYYENFRLRAMAHGRITEDDFLSEREKFDKYNQPFYNNGYGNPYNNQYGNQYGNNGNYYNPFENSQPNNNGGYYAPQNGGNQQGYNGSYNYDYQSVNNSGEYSDQGAQNGFNAYYTPPQATAEDTPQAEQQNGDAVYPQDNDSQADSEN